MSFIRRTSAMFIALLSVISFTACSDDQAKEHAVSSSVVEASQADSEQAITQRLTTLGLPVEAIHDSEVDGFKQVETPFGIFYVSSDGKHFIQGRIFEFDEKGNMKDLLAARFSKLVDSQSENMIVFPAKNEKHVITVFTDTTCGYCTKLHKEMKGYNDAGITVRYLAYPRQGYQGTVADKMAQIWCADDKQQAMEDAKSNRAINGSKPATAECKNIIKEQYLLGRKMGVNGTPAIVLPNGDLVPGYKPAQELLKDLEK
ncbi:bifunctional protein-disulfide isomerase/oxidoreductase DsbC [Aliivibrio salmonicida]|uniref:bifunctional protein-disulfide isomerase/oxidoreductase DsbC n=1 Tax=Aliivibrio salmonicida TaxID=40269 RepID=UPI00406C2825